MGRIHLLVKEMQVPPLDQQEPLEKEMATHSSILAWELPWTGEPGGLQSIGSQSQARLTMQAQVYTVVILFLLCSKL